MNQKQFLITHLVIFNIIFISTGCGKKHQSLIQSQADSAPSSVQTGPASVPVSNIESNGNDVKIEKSDSNQPLIVSQPDKKDISPNKVLECRFSFESSEKDPKKLKCIFSALICGNQNQDCKNQLTLACNGQKIYSDAALYSTVNDLTYLIAQGANSFIMLILPTSSLEKPDDFNAILKLNNDQLVGVCSVDQFPNEEKKFVN